MKRVFVDFFWDFKEELRYYYYGFLVRFSNYRKNKLYEKGQRKKKDILSVYFGVPGSGKTTFAAYNAKRMLKYGIPVWSNVPITGCYELDVHQDIGHNMIYNGLVIIDEAGIDYNNRKFKSFTDEENKWFKYHRHYRCAVDIFSQGWNDMDLKLRILAQRFYVVKKSLIPFFVYRRRIRKVVGINEYDKQIIDAYDFVPFSRKYIFCPPLWKMFNTLSHDELPSKDWQQY